MFYKLEIKDHIRVPPNLFDLSKGRGYGSNFVFEFHISDLQGNDIQNIKSMEKGKLNI